MRLRNVTGSEELIAKSRYVCSEPMEFRGKWNSYFGNANPIYIEIGMGKGKFISEMARLNPGVNFIGIEKYTSVLYRAVKKVERAALNVDNLVFLWLDARDLKEVFGKGEVGRIFLNFSDPWPKDRHARRRITSRDFLGIYDEVLVDGGRIEVKTDNKKLFRFTLAEGDISGWKVDEISEDLHGDEGMMAQNVMTEYEEKFSAKGNPIFRCVISRCKCICMKGKGIGMSLMITSDNFDKEVLESELPVLVDFYADWCGPCVMMAPVIDSLTEEYAGRFKVGKCNIDDEMELAGKYRIMSIPAMVFFKDGKAVETYVGVMTKDELAGKIEELME